MAVSTYISTNSEWGSPFSTSSSAFIVCRFFNDGHSDKVRWYLIVILICVSLIMNHVEHLFIVCWPSVCLLWRNVCLGLPLRFWLGCLFFWYWAACTFWRIILCHLFHLQLFFPILKGVFKSWLLFPCCTKTIRCQNPTTGCIPWKKP